MSVYYTAVEAAVNRVIGRYPDILPRQLQPVCSVSGVIGQIVKVQLVGGGAFTVACLYNGDSYHAHTDATSLMSHTDRYRQPWAFRPIYDMDRRMEIMLAYVTRTVHRVMQLASGVVRVQRAFRDRTARRRAAALQIQACFRAAVSDPARGLCRSRLAREFDTM